MNYLNYWTTIIQKYHVQLLGWPAGIPFTNPHQLTTTATARELQKALIVLTCKWVILSKQQWQEHATALEVDIERGQSIGKKRKQRSDKGKKRKHTMATNNDKEDQEEEEDDKEDDKENERLGPTKKHKSAASTKRSTATANKSKAAGMSRKSKVSPSVVKKASRIVGMLLPAAPKSKEYIDTEDESDGWRAEIFLMLTFAVYLPPNYIAFTLAPL